MAGLIGSIGAGFLGGMIMGGVIPFSNIMNYAANQICPNTLPDPNTLITAYTRGALTQEELRNGLRKLGFNDKAIDAMLAATAPMLSPGALTEAYQRGIINKDEFYNGMRKLGYNDQQIKALYDASLRIPTPDEALKLYRTGKIDKETYEKYLRANGLSEDTIKQWEAINAYVPTPDDLVRFAVRETLDPVAAEKLGLYQDIPSEYLEEAKKLGMDEETAKRYWAAHWQLPGPGQVMDMYRMGLFGDPDSPEAKETVDAYLKAADYSPYWRDKLRNLIWSPYTRVDAGRMYLNDIISEDELYENFRKLGYDDEHARNMVEFYKKQKQEAEEKEQEKKQKAAASKAKAATTPRGQTAKDKDVSLSLIKKAYYYGELTRDEAKGLVSRLDYDPWECELIVTLWDDELEIKDKEDQIEYLSLAYKKGVINEDEYFRELASLGLTATAINILKLKNSMQRKIEEKLPSKADLQRWLKKGFIDPNIFMYYMQQLNYPNELIYLYYRDVTG